MPNNFDLLRYAKTGISAPDMSAYYKPKAIAMCGDSPAPHVVGYSLKDSDGYILKDASGYIITVKE